MKAKQIETNAKHMSLFANTALENCFLNPEAGPGGEEPPIRTQREGAAGPDARLLPGSGSRFGSRSVSASGTGFCHL